MSLAEIRGRQQAYQWIADDLEYLTKYRDPREALRTLRDLLATEGTK